MDLFDVFLEGYKDKSSRSAALTMLYHHLETNQEAFTNKEAAAVLINTAAAFISHHQTLFRPPFGKLSLDYRHKLNEGLNLLYYAPNYYNKE